MKRIGLTIVALSILLLVGWFFGRSFQAETAGTLHLVLVNQSTEVRRDEVAYYQGDSLYDVLDRQYTVRCADAAYQPTAACEPLAYSEFTGRILLEVDELKSNWRDTFIQIQINGTPAVYGVDQLRFNDQDEIRLVLRNAD